jgi:hypothetical protein
MKTVDGAAELAPDQARTTVFLSYSRADSAQMQRIAAALAAAGYCPNYDSAHSGPTEPEIGIAAQDEWWQRLQAMIIDAEVTVLLVSPTSARSRVVGDEIAFARGEGKRIIPVLCSPVDFNTAAPALAALNVGISIVDRGPDAFSEAMTQLTMAIDQDIQWLRMARSLNQKSREWRDAGQAPDRLLHGVAIAEAERWSARRPASAPVIGEATLAFILASRDEEENRVRNEHALLDRQRRMQRWIGALVALALLVGVVGMVLLWNRQLKVAHAESVMLARAAEELFTQGDYVRAMRLSALGLSNGLSRPGSPEADAIFRRSALSPVLEREFPASGTVTTAWAAPDGRLVAISSSAGQMPSFWHAETEAWAGGYPVKAPVAEAGFAAAPRGLRFLSWGLDLKRSAAFEAGDKADVARMGGLWKVDSAGNVTESFRRHYPILGALLPTAEGPVVTWGRASVALWSGAFDRRLAEIRPGGPVETVLDIGDGKRVLVLMRNGDVQIRSVEAMHPLELLAATSIGKPARDLAIALPQNLALLVTTEGEELIALELPTLTVRYRGVQQQCCLGPPQVAQRRTGPAVILNVLPMIGARLIRADNGEVVSPLFPHKAIRGARLDEKGERVVTFGFDNAALIWNARTGKPRAAITQNDFVGNLDGPRGPAGGVRGAIFIDDGAEVVLWNYDGTIRIYDSSTGKQLGGHMRHPGSINEVRVLPGRRLMTAADGPVRIWRLPDYAVPVTSLDGLCASAWRRRKTVRLSRTVRGGAALSVVVTAAERAVLSPSLTIDAEDAQLVPILKGREGEALCAS